jgi:hypothetical protein
MNNRQAFPTPEIFDMGDNRHVTAYSLDGQFRQVAIEQISTVLKAKWAVAGMPGEEDYELIRSTLADAGVDISAIGARRGAGGSLITDAQKASRDQKDKGDLCEVLCALLLEASATVDQDDVFLILSHKRTANSSPPGIDYLAFKWDDSNETYIPNEAERLVIGEAKHTTSLTDASDPCRAFAGWIMKLSQEKLYQELACVREEYRLRRQQVKGNKTLSFLLNFAKRQENVELSCEILVDSRLRIDRLVSTAQQVFDAAQTHPEGPIPHDRVRLQVFAVDDLETFANECYEGLS